MKLQDALKKIIREFGMSVLREKRLLFILSDYKAFDDYPAVKQIMQSIAEDGYGKELCRLVMDGNSEECLNYAGRLKKTLSGDKHFKPELADYAVDCILFSMGFVSSVREPSDHGFDPFGNGSASHEQGIRQKDSGSGSHKNENQTGTESAEDWYRLGMSYANGSGVNQNYSMAVEYWRKAAELGYSGAQRCLGFAYAHGQGVAHDNAKALMWYRKAAAQGDSIARLELNSLLGDIQRSQEQSAGMTAAAGSPEKAQMAAGIQRKSVSQAASTPTPVRTETGTGSSTASQQNHVSAGSQGNQASSGDSPDRTVVSDRIGRTKFWLMNILLCLVLVGLFSLVLFIITSFNIKEKSFIYWVLVLLGGLSAKGCFYAIGEIWERRAHDLGEDYSYSYGVISIGYMALLAYFSIPLFVLAFVCLFGFLFGGGDWDWYVLLIFILCLVIVVPGGVIWIRFGFVKGTDGDNRYGPDPTK